MWPLLRSRYYEDFFAALLSTGSKQSHSSVVLLQPVQYCTPSFAKETRPQALQRPPLSEDAEGNAMTVYDACRLLFIGLSESSIAWSLIVLKVYRGDGRESLRLTSSII